MIARKQRKTSQVFTPRYTLKSCVYNAVCIFLHPPPPALPQTPLPAIIFHNSYFRVIKQSYLKSARAIEVVFCGRLIF